MPLIRSQLGWRPPKGIIGIGLLLSLALLSQLVYAGDTDGIGGVLDLNGTNQSDYAGVIADHSSGKEIDTGERVRHANLNKNKNKNDDGNGKGHWKGNHHGKSQGGALPDPAWLGPGGTATAPATGTWNTAGNWSPSGVPASGSPLTFGGSGSTPYTSTNDLSSTYTLGTVNLGSTASVTEIITGNSFNVTSSAISQDNSGAFTIQNNMAATTATTLTLTGNGTGLVTLSGILSDKNSGNKLSVVKAANSSSTFVLGGANTYTGATQVNGGTLLVNGSTASGSAVTVSNTGTVLGGTGTIAGTVNVGVGAIINPGPKGADGTSVSVGTLTTGALTLNSTATFHGDAFGIAANQWDKLVVNGAAALGAGTATLQLVIASGLTFVPNTTYTLIDATSISGTFAGIADGSTQIFNGYSFIAHYNLAGDGNFELTAVPEPGTWFGAGLACAALLILQRRRLSRLVVGA